MNIVLLKAVLSILLIGLSLIVFYWREKIPTRYVTGKALVVAWLMLRLVPFLSVYVALGLEPRSDITGFLVGWGNHARSGELIYRDFVCTYSPFFPYLIGLSMAIWNDPRAIVFLMVLLEGLALVATYYLYQPKFPRPELLTRLLIYLCLPASLLLCILGGQEDVWTWLFIALAAWGFYKKGSYLLYGSLLVLGLLSTKATFVLVLPALLLLVPKPYRLFGVLAGWGLVVLILLYALVGLEFTQPLGEADTLRSPNILSVVNPLFFDVIGVGQKFWNWVGLVTTVGISCLTAWRLRNADYHQAISRVFVVTYATMMIAQQSAYSNYIFLYLIPLVFYVVDWRNKVQVGLLLLFNFLCVVHPSYWWRLGMPRYLMPSDIWASPALLLDYLMQVAIVILTGYFVRLAVKNKAIPTTPGPY
jgi:hypothetical protein